jgi:hypothetical protein
MLGRVVEMQGGSVSARLLKKSSVVEAEKKSCGARQE